MESVGYVAFAGVVLGGVKGFLGAKGVNNVLKNTENTITKAGNCCVAGTEILTVDGIKNIEDIQVADWVIADDPTTPGGIEARQVLKAFVRETDALVDLYVDGEVISTTKKHPFWVADKGWVEVADLVVGSLLQTGDGRVVDVDRVEKREGKFEVYNFRVEGFPTYYVSELGILVHNANYPPLTPPPNPTGPISMDDAVSLGAQHVGDGEQIGTSGSGGYQFISTGRDAQGNNVARVARFDINPNSPHVQQAGPHLNLKTQINGRPVRNGSLADSHIPIDPNTITQTGDIP